MERYLFSKNKKKQKKKLSLVLNNNMEQVY